MGTTMTDDVLAASCHANCVEAARESARRSLTAGEIVERDGVLLFATGSDFPIIANGAFRLDPAVEPDEVIRVADSWFAERGRGWSLGVTSWADADQDLRDAAEVHGLVQTVEMPGMVRLEPIAETTTPDGIEVRILTTEDEAVQFVAMNDRAYTSLGLPPGVFTAMAGLPMRTPPPHEVTVGLFDDGALVSGAQVIFSNGIAGIYAVGTAEEARGRGLAELATRVVTNLAFDRGAPAVTLQASPMGEAIYARMGYQELYRYANLTRFA